MPKSYRAYVGTSTLPDICKTVESIKHPEKCLGIITPPLVNPQSISKPQVAPKYSPQVIKPNANDWESDTPDLDVKFLGSSKKDEAKSPVTIVKTSGGRNQVVTGATSHDVDTSGDDLQRYLPYIVAGGAGLMLVMMMFSMM